MSARNWPLDVKPIIVFWESTKACLLTCIHCRAEAILKPLPGELNTEEALKLVDDILEFGSPYPVLVVTGGDPLMRGDLWDVISYALSRGIKIALAPSVTPLLNDATIKRIADIGVSAVSISIDSPYPEVHDRIRGVKGTWARSVEIVKSFNDYGVKVQINTVVMRPTVEGLADMVGLLRRLSVDTWEVFYLVRVGRAGSSLDLESWEWEDVSNFLYEASKYDLEVRTVEGPQFRRVVLYRRFLESRGLDFASITPPGTLYSRLVSRLRELLGRPAGEPRVQTAGTRDGRGIVFVAYNGDVYPSGFLPISAGNIRFKSLREIYVESKLFKDLRSANFKGRCGQCEFKFICGGSRARAYSTYGDPLAEDPACPYEPGLYGRLGFKIV